MINGINSTGSAMYTMRTNEMKPPPPPPPEENAFQVADSDSDGLVAGVELEAIIEGIAEITGNTISTDDALSGFDADGDGGLNGKELLALLKDNGFTPPEGPSSEDGGTQGPSPVMSQALASYAQNSGDDLVQQLINHLKGSESGQEQDSLLSLSA